MALVFPEARKIFDATDCTTGATRNVLMLLSLFAIRAPGRIIK